MLENRALGKGAKVKTACGAGQWPGIFKEVKLRRIRIDCYVVVECSGGTGCEADNHKG